MSSLTPFSFESHEIRTLTIGENPWFVAKDVAEALEYVWKGTSGTIGHVPEEWRGVCSVQTPSGIQEMATLSEPGLYFFINRSDKPKALPFQKWVAGDVIPAIRKTGGYALPGTQPQPSDIAALAQQLADLLKGKVVVDYEALCRLARMTRAGLQKIAEGEKLLEEAEQVGLDLERQCGKPLIKFDIPANRLARQRTTRPESRPKRPASLPDPWEPKVLAYVAGRPEVTSTSVLTHLGVPMAEQTQVPKNRIAKIMIKQGFTSYRAKRSGRTTRIWQRHHHA